MLSVVEGEFFFLISLSFTLFAVQDVIATKSYFKFIVKTRVCVLGLFISGSSMSNVFCVKEGLC